MTLLPMAAHNADLLSMLGIQNKRRGMFGTGGMSAPTHLTEDGDIQSKAGALPVPSNTAPPSVGTAVVPAASVDTTANDVMGVPRKRGMMGRRSPWESSGWEKVANVLSALGTSFMSAQASANGDFGAAAALNNQLNDQFAGRRQRAQMGTALRNLGYNDDQIMVALSDPQSLSRNFNERFGTRVLSPGSSVVTGGPNGQGSTFSQPNQFEAYAHSLGLKPGTREYNTALTDYVLRGNGPTAYGYDQSLEGQRAANDTTLEGVRQGNRVDLETIRQKNRVNLRGVPSYRDTNPAPPRASGGAPSSGGGGRRTATGPNGEKIEWNGRAWVPAA